jgi:hypothetical protein
MAKTREAKIRYTQSELEFLIYHMDSVEEAQALAFTMKENMKTYDMGWFCNAVTRFKEQLEKLTGECLDHLFEDL